jgi:hypothetical protein
MRKLRKSSYFHTACFSFDVEAHDQLKSLASAEQIPLSLYLRQLIKETYSAQQKKQDLDIEQLLARIA